MLLVDKIQELLDHFLGLVHRYVLELIILMFMTLFSLWTFAFLANGLYGYKFDLQSCWGGFSAIGGAGVLAAIKYCTDSWKNSPEGIAPGNIINKVTDMVTKKTTDSYGTKTETKETITSMQQSRGGKE